MAQITTIPLPSNYQYGFWLDFNKQREIKQFEEVGNDYYIRKSFIDDNVKIILKFKNDVCKVEVLGLDDDISKSDKLWLNNHLYHILDIHNQYSNINNKLSRIKGLSKLKQQNLSVPIARYWGVLESILRIIIEQLVTVKAAKTIINNLFNNILLKQKITTKTPLQSHFTLTNNNICLDSLDKITFLPKMKKNAIFSVLDKFDNNLLFETTTMNYNDIEKLLLPIKGIGVWTCSCVAMRSQTDINMFIEKDLIIDRWISSKKLTNQSIKRRTNPYCAYFANYIWFLSTNKLL